MDKNRRHKLRRDRALARGQCKDCGKRPRHLHLTRCLDCSFKFLASKHLGSASRWTELRDVLLRQKHRCAYSGRKINIGENASVEHVVASSRDKRRRTDISNIKFVDTEINLMKSRAQLHDFLMTCKEVLTHFGYEVGRDDSK